MAIFDGFREMKRNLKIILFSFFLVLIIGFVIYKIPKISFQFKSSTLPDSKIQKGQILTKEEKILNKLTLEQKIGQLFIIGFEGKNLNSQLENLIKKIQPGGILLLSKKDFLIISDDLSSPVLKKEFSLENTVILTPRAGIDILIVAGFDEPEDPLLAYNFLLEAAKNGEISEDRINQSVLKIIKLKKNLLQ